MGRFATPRWNVSKPSSLGTGCDAPAKVPSGLYARIPFCIIKKVSSSGVSIESFVCVPYTAHQRISSRAKRNNRKKLAKKIVDTARKPSEPGREVPPFDSTANAHWMLTSALETAISEKFMAFPKPPDGHCAVVCRATGEVRERVVRNETARMER